MALVSSGFYAPQILDISNIQLTAGLRNPNARLQNTNRLGCSAFRNGATQVSMMLTVSNVSRATRVISFASINGASPTMANSRPPTFRLLWNSFGNTGVEQVS